MILLLANLALGAPPLESPLFPLPEPTYQRTTAGKPLPTEWVVCLRPEIKLHFGGGRIETALYPAGLWLPEGSRAAGHGP